MSGLFLSKISLAHTKHIKFSSPKLVTLWIHPGIVSTTLGTSPVVMILNFSSDIKFLKVNLALPVTVKNFSVLE